MNPYEDDPTNMQGPPPPPPPPPGRPLNQSQKSAIAAALVGTAALGGAAYGLAQFMNEDTEPDPKPEPHPQPIPHPIIHNVVNPIPGPPPVIPPVDPPVSPEGDHEPRVSEHNFDKMTFPEAFHEAREEMGKGNYFEWHGHLYNTYHQEEWEKMTPGQHQDFLASVYGEDSPEMHSGDASGGHSGHEGHGGSAALAGGNGEIPPPPDVPPAIDDISPEHSNAAVAGATTGHETANTDITVEDTLPGHESADHHTADAGSVTIDEHTADGHGHSAREADIAVVNLDGHDVSVIDVDHDGHADALVGHDNHVAYFDTNHDHIMDTQATYDPATHTFVDQHEISIALDSSMDMDTLHDGMTHEVHFASNTDTGLGPDFDNNADITDFA